MNNVKRESNIELLRIIAMLLVLFDHVGYIALNPPSANDLYTDPILSFGRFNQQAITTVAVNVFVLISGWFGIRFRLSRVLELLFQTYFICFSVYLFLLLFHFTTPMSVREWLNFLVFDDLWFVKAYLVMYLFAPMMNSYIDTIRQKQFLFFIIAFYLLQTIHGFLTTTTLWFKEGMSPLSLMGIYMIGRYMRKYPKRLVGHSKLVYFTTFAALTLITASLSYVSVKCGAEGYRFYSYASPLIILSAISFFLFFSKLSFSSRIVNWVAASSFSAYVLHSEPHAFKKYLSTVVLWWNSNPTCVFYLKVIMGVFCIFTVSILLDKVRIFLWSKLSNTVTS